MTAQELRIGNYVIIEDDLLEVTALSDMGDCYVIQPLDDHDGVASIEWLQPIPLTPEVLEACGFEIDGFGAYNLYLGVDIAYNTLVYVREYLYIRQGLNSHPRRDDDISTLYNEDVRGKLMLHTLQNIIFVITGQELTIDIDKLKNAVK